MKTFARYFAITFGVVLGALAAISIVGLVAWGAYSLYRTDQDRRAGEQANARATVVAQDRATATTRQSEDRATATALRTEEELRQRSASATAEAVKLAARRCQNPAKLVVQARLNVATSSTAVATFNRYAVSGTVSNTCNFDIVFNFDLVGMAQNGVSIVDAKTVTISGDVNNSPGQGKSALIRAGTERLFEVYFTDRRTPDIASVRVIPNPRSPAV